MAQKRMFDKKVVESDKFIDLPNSAKALYFMAGMDADDKGFFQPRKLQRLCGFSDDDYKILIAKRFFISFESGVMVITDWNKNNYLDKNRITPTEYIDELKMLDLINEKYELDTRLTNVKQSLNQNSIVQHSIDENNSVQHNIVQHNTEEILCPAVQDNIPYHEIVNYLNQVTGAHYKPSSNKTKTCIHARWQEGFRLDDFKIVINKKYNEWVGTELEKYLRPETLFGTKFESYLNQADIPREITTKDVEKIIDWEGYLND